MPDKRRFLLRLNPDIYAALERWAADEFRSVNGQMEFLLGEALRLVLAFMADFTPQGDLSMTRRMIKMARVAALWSICLLLMLPATITVAQEGAEDNPDTIVAALEAQCEASAAERTARHQATPLFERLGGEEGLMKMSREIIRMHMENPELVNYFESVDHDRLATNLTAFVAAGTGGPQNYQGRDMPTVHADMNITNALFLSAGGDVGKAMQNLGYGEEETEEIICILVSLREQVMPSAE